MSFFYDTEMVEGETSFCLGYCKETDDEHDILIKISPKKGNNLYCFRVDSYEIVHHDTRFSLSSYYTGNPILFPFPNRVRNCRYAFDGKWYWQNKHGIPIFLHSLVFDEAWESDEPVITEDSVSLRTWITVHERHPIYEAYPFAHTLYVDFSVTKSGFEIRYMVHNEGAERLPYGISFHTFFKKLCGDDGSFISVPANHMMELDEALLPTGKLLDVEGEWFDLRERKPTSALDLDNCYTTMIPDKRTCIDYPALGFRVYMDSTDEFTHVQVFTPKGKPFFCVEAQTCSTDAINLDRTGFKEEAHLLTLEPGEQRGGTVTFTYERIRG